MEFDWLGFRIGFNSQPISNSNKIMDLKEKPQKQVPLRLNRANYCPTSLLTDPTRQLHHHVKFSRDLGLFEFHTPPCLALTLWKHNLDFYLMSSYTYIYVCIQCIRIHIIFYPSKLWNMRDPPSQLCHAWPHRHLWKSLEMLAALGKVFLRWMRFLLVHIVQRFFSRQYHKHPKVQKQKKLCSQNLFLGMILWKSNSCCIKHPATTIDIMFAECTLIRIIIWIPK